MSNQETIDCCSPVTRAALSSEQATDLAGIFKALADPVRIRLLSMIATAPGGESCVCDLADGFDVSQPTISHHLKVLRQAGLLTSERRASWVYYRAVPERIAAISALFTVDPAG
jgi:ArsR family transcriptional regulator